MGKIRKIDRKQRNYFIVDATTLADKYIPLKYVQSQDENKTRFVHAWWSQIDDLLKKQKARVYIPDICIAETFKTLARKYHNEKILKYQPYQKSLQNLRSDIQLNPSTLRKQDRYIKYHDLSTTRDIIISIDRFYEIFFKNGFHVSVPDLIIISSAKYLMDFYDIPKNQIHILTSDQALLNGCRKTTEIPYAYDPRKQDPNTIFIN